jgi:hypothetical protein
MEPVRAGIVRPAAHLVFLLLVRERWNLNLEDMTTDLQCRCGTTFSIARAGTSSQVLWLVQAPDAAEGFQRADVTAAHRLHECPKCGRLLYVSAPGQVSTLVREG